MTGPRVLPLALLVLALLVAPPPTAADSALRGTVADVASGTPLPGANVALLGTVLGTVSGRDGDFVLPRVPAGTYRLRVSMIGYRDARLDVTVPADAPVRVALVPAAIELNPVVVTADRRAQTLETSSQSVTVLSSSDIEDRTNLRLDDALEMVPACTSSRTTSTSAAPPATAPTPAAACCCCSTACR